MSEPTPPTSSSSSPPQVAAVVEGAFKGVRTDVRSDIAGHPFTTVLAALAAGLVLGAGAGVTLALHFF